MSNNINIADVRRKAAYVGDLMRQTPKTTGYPILSEGSATYGRAYRLNIVPVGHSYHARPPFGDDYLGMNKSDAFHALHSLQNMVEAWADGANFKLDYSQAAEVADLAVKTKRVDWSLWTDLTPWTMSDTTTV